MLLAYLAVQPAPEERVEFAIAQFISVYRNAHVPENEEPKSAMDFLPFLDPWAKEAKEAAEAEWAKAELMKP